jgi:hypothetical protein
MHHARFKPHAVERAYSPSQRPEGSCDKREPKKTIIPKDLKVHQERQLRGTNNDGGTT